MDILLVTRGSKENKFGISSRKHISKIQPQYSWYNALVNLNYKVKIHVVQPNLNLKFRILNNITPFISSTELFFTVLLNNSSINYILVSGGIGKIASIFLLVIKNIFKKKIIYLNGTSPKFFNYDSFEHRLASKSNLIVTNSESQLLHWKNISLNNKISYPISGCDIDHNNFIFNKTPKYDITFIGSLDEDIYKFRIKYLMLIKEFNLNIWSSSKNIKELLKKYNLLKFYRGPCNRLESFKIYNDSKIVLNIQHIESMSNGGNLSLFEIPFSKGFQITNVCSENYFTIDKEIIIFNDYDDLINKINFFMKKIKLRENIIKKAFLKCVSHHTYEKRFSNFLNIINN